MDKCMFALWGKLAAEILVSQWDAALDSLNRLRELIDDPKNPGILPALVRPPLLVMRVMDDPKNPVLIAVRALALCRDGG